MAFINDLITFANPAAITAMSADRLANLMFYACTNTGEGYPGWYQYQSGSSATLDSPAVIDVTNGAGRFILFGGVGGGATVLSGAGDPNSDAVAWVSDAIFYDTLANRQFIANPAGDVAPRWRPAGSKNFSGYESLPDAFYDGDMWLDTAGAVSIYYDGDWETLGNTAAGGGGGGGF